MCVCVSVKNGCQGVKNVCIRKICITRHFSFILSSHASIIRVLTEKALSIAEGVQVALPVEVQWWW